MTTLTVSGLFTPEMTFFGFTFSIPQNLIVMDRYENAINLKSVDFTVERPEYYETRFIKSGYFISIMQMPGDNTISMKDWELIMVDQKPEKIKNKKYFKIDGAEAVEFGHNSGENMNNHEVVIILRKNKAYKIEQEYNYDLNTRPGVDEFSQIINSIKFDN